jgi:hypothetical protein
MPGPLMSLVLAQSTPLGAQFNASKPNSATNASIIPATSSRKDVRYGELLARGRTARRTERPDGHERIRTPPGCRVGAAARTL